MGVHAKRSCMPQVCSLYPSFVLAICWSPACVAAEGYVDAVWRTTANEMASEAGLTGSFTSIETATNLHMTVYVSNPRDSVMTRQVPADGFPVVLIAHHAVGIYHATFLRKFADDLASKGFVALLPDLFHRTWSKHVPTGHNASFDTMNIPALLSSMKDADIIEDLTATLDLLRLEQERWKANADRVAVLGFCMGGRIAWLAAVEETFKGRLRAAVTYHGGNTFKSLPDGAGTAPAKRLPSKLHCPVLGHFGEADGNPSLQDMRRLEELSKPSGLAIEFHTYAGAKHGFSCADSSNYLPESASVAWTRTVEFLERVARRDASKARGEL